MTPNDTFGKGTNPRNVLEKRDTELKRRIKRIKERTLLEQLNDNSLVNIQEHVEKTAVTLGDCGSYLMAFDRTMSTMKTNIDAALDTINLQLSLLNGEPRGGLVYISHQVCIPADYNHVELCKVCVP